MVLPKLYFYKITGIHIYNLYRIMAQMIAATQKA